MLRCSVVASAFHEPILDGRVRVRGLELELHPSPSATVTTPEMLAGRYDIGEMSLAFCAQARARGDDLFALPIFTSRRFFQPCAAARNGSGIDGYAALRGRRVGLPHYWMTSSIWHRASLRRFGIEDGEIEWHTARTERVEQEAVPRGVRVVDHAGTTVETLLHEGAIDAILVPRLPSFDAVMHPLYEDPQRAAYDELQATGLVPLVHVVAVRGRALRQTPDLAARLLDLFSEAKSQALAHPTSTIPESAVPGVSYELVRERFGELISYGEEANARAIEAFLDIAAVQGLTGRRLDRRELFATSA